MCQFFLLALFVASVAGQMTQAFRDNILRDHNEKRRQATNGANMIELRYDMALERTAQAYLARGCSGGFQHNSNRGCDYKAQGGTNGGTGTCASVGENWYSGAPDNTTGVEVVIGGAVAQWTDGTCSSWASPPLRCGSRWCSEKQNFYQTASDSYGRCTQTSGQTLHWTQAMWATTTHVGCGYTTACGTLCNYAPSGNINLPSMGSMIESNVWRIGTPCSSCPSGYGTCNRGLCSASTSTPTTCPADSTKPTNGNAGTCGSTTAVGSSCSLACNSGYRLSSGSLTRTCSSTGTLSAMTAVCTAITTCPADTTTKPANGNVGNCGSAIAVGSTCSVACNTGYRLSSGSLSRQCTSTGSLSSMTAVCTAITCPADSTKPANGDVGTCNTQRAYGQTCSQTCNTGYYVSSGSLVRTCGTTGQYGSSNAVCSIITCPGTTGPANGNAGTCSTTKNYGQTCTQACNSGYTLQSGSLVRTCGVNGQFSANTAVCSGSSTPAPTPAPTPTPTTRAPTPAPSQATGSYCTSGPTSDVDSEFNGVTLTGWGSAITDTEGCPGSTGPTETGLTVTLVRGETYTLNFLRSTCGDYYTALAGAWVDWDQDKTWESTELLFTFTQTYGQNTKTFTVPTTALIGRTKMRLQVQETDALTINPCANFQWGDTKDYWVNVIGAKTCAGNPTIKPINGNAGTCLSTANYGSTCTQRCNMGYQLVAGTLESECGPLGTWSASNAICEAIPFSALAPSIPSSSQATTTETTTSETVGQAVVAVTPTITCAPDMTAPINGGSGTCSSTTTYPDTCIQTCNEGYSISGGSLERACNVNGNYTPTTAICAANFCAPDSTVPLNGGQGSCAERTALGAICTLTCNTGFSLRAGTSLERACTANGLTASTAICE